MHQKIIRVKLEGIKLKTKQMGKRKRIRVKDNEKPVDWLNEELIKLQTLLSDGAISKEEFDKLKARLEE